MNYRVILFASLMFLLFFVATPAVAAPVLLFDEGHAQQFLPDREGELDLSKLSGIMKKAGFEVRSSKESLSDSTLDKIDALLLSGPFLPLSSDELDAVARFLERGGALCVMIHIPQPVGPLLHRLNLDFANGVVREAENVIDGDPLNYRVVRLEQHPLTEGLEGFAVYGGWAVRNTDEASHIIASTGSHASIDLNGDGKGDAMQPFGLLVAGTFGNGRFAVFGDDAIFQNRFLKDENVPLAENLARWLKP